MQCTHDVTSVGGVTVGQVRHNSSARNARTTSLVSALSSRMYNSLSFAQTGSMGLLTPEQQKVVQDTWAPVAANAKYYGVGLFLK